MWLPHTVTVTEVELSRRGTDDLGFVSLVSASAPRDRCCPDTALSCGCLDPASTERISSMG